MTTKCPYCDSEVSETNPAIVLHQLKEAVTTNYSWSTIENWNVGRSFRVGNETAELVDKKIDPGYPANGYDGAWDQGTEFTAHLVIRFMGSYFKKTGTGDSYGEIAWDGELTPAKVTEKVVKVYE